MTSNHFQFQQIGVVHSCYQQKFGIPRQPGLVTAAECELELLPPFNQENTLRGLEGFSHLWIHFIFHQTMQEGWRPTIRPPRLGGKQRVGVFATRSTHRPNPLGLSVVKLTGINRSSGQLTLSLTGADLLDETPVVDIKPYLPYCDAIPTAKGGFVPTPRELVPVHFSEPAMQQAMEYEQKHERSLITLIKQVIGQDPRPAYLQSTSQRRHGFMLWDINVVWESRGEYFYVTALE